MKLTTATTTSLSILIPLAAASTLPLARQAAPRPPVPQPDAGAGPFHFTSTFNLVATPDKVIGPNNQSAPGEAGAIGYYNYGINTDLDVICYNITLIGVTGPCDSPAVTATHIHEAADGRAGPPRIAFPNPEPADSGPEVVKRSSGCIAGPFKTGINGTNGADTGEGFTLAQIEANPVGFFTDSHTQKSVPGVVRAQLVRGAVPQQGNAQGPKGAPGAPPPPPPPAPAEVQHAQGPIPNAHGGLSNCQIQVVNVGPPVKAVCLD